MRAIASILSLSAFEPQGVREWVPQRLQVRGFLLEHFQWIGLAVLLLLAWLGAGLVRQFSRRVLRHLQRFGGKELDRETLLAFERPLGLVVVAALFARGLRWLDLAPSAESVLDLAARTVEVCGSVWAAYRLVDVLTWKLARTAESTASRFDDMLVPLLRRTLRALVLGVGLLYLASWFSGDVWHVLAGLSIGSLALGFAAKDSIENLFGTFTVLLDRPFHLGETILFEGREGLVESVGFRSTRLRSPGDTLISIPNRKFIGETIENLGSRRWRRASATLSLVYGTPPEKIEAFCEGLRELIRGHPLTKKSEYQVWLNQLGASSLDVLLVYFLEVSDPFTENREKHRLLLDVLRLAQRLGVEFAFPTQTVWVAQAQPAAPSGPPAQRLARRSSARAGRAAGAELARSTRSELGDAARTPVRFDLEDPDAAGAAGVLDEGGGGDS
jgi:MscS family membrane protein